MRAPTIPWQVTGNHWLAIPCIHPADGAIYAVGVLHHASRAVIELAGSSDFINAQGDPLLRPVLRVNGEVRELSAEGIAWERAMDWLPTFTCTVGSLVVRGTVFAPYGRDADMAGAAYAFTLENRGATATRVEVALDGVLGHRQQRVVSARAFDDNHVVDADGNETVVLEGSTLPGPVALAIGADGPLEITAEVEPSREPRRFSIRRELDLAPGSADNVVFYMAVGPERDGARATVSVLKRRGWRALLASTRAALAALEQTTANEALDRLVNRNLVFAYFYAVGRGLDDAQYYFLRTRVPWHDAGCTIRDWEALMWTLPAIQIADSTLARELLIRCCELHGYAPGQGVHYFDGTLFKPGFTVEGPAAFAIALDRYLSESEDPELVEEPVVQDTLYLVAEELAARRDERVPLFGTELTLSGKTPAYPYTLHGNAAASRAFEILRRLIDEDSVSELDDPDAIRAAMRFHFAVDRADRSRLATSVNLAGGADNDDDPSGSLLWLPLYGAVEADDPLYKRSVEASEVEPQACGALVLQIARLTGKDAELVTAWLRRAALDSGVAAEFVDAAGQVVANGGDAALAGLLAYMLWLAGRGEAFRAG